MAVADLDTRGHDPMGGKHAVMAGHCQRLGIATRAFSRYAAVWRLRACRAFLIAQFVSILGSSAFRVAIAWYSIATLHSPVALGWVLAASSIPQLLLGPAAGILGDKLGRKRVVVASDITSGACYLAFFGLASARILEIPELLGLAVIAGVSSATFIPNASALIPAIASQGHVSEANAARMITTQIASVLGPALAGALIPVTGIPVIFLANGASFLVSALIFGRTRVSAVPIQRRGGRKEEGSGRAAPPRLFAAGILRDRAIRAGVLLGAAGNLLLVAPVAVFFPALVSASHHGAASLGGFMASQAAGLVLGALAAPCLTRDARPDMRIAFAGIAAGAGCLYVLPYALANGYTLILAGLAMGGPPLPCSRSTGSPICNEMWITACSGRPVRSTPGHPLLAGQPASPPPDGFSVSRPRHAACNGQPWRSARQRFPPRPLSWPGTEKDRDEHIR